MDAGAGAGREGDGGEDGGCDDGVGGEEAFVWRCGGGVGGMAHLEGEAVVFVDEEVAAGEGDVVGELGAVLVDVVAVFRRGEKISIGLGGGLWLAGMQHTGEHILFEFVAPFLELLHWESGQEPC